MQLQEVLHSSADALYEVGLEESAAAKAMQQHLPGLQAFLETYVQPHHMQQQPSFQAAKQSQAVETWPTLAAQQHHLGHGKQHGPQGQQHSCQREGQHMLSTQRHSSGRLAQQQQQQAASRSCHHLLQPKQQQQNEPTAKGGLVETGPNTKGKMTACIEDIVDIEENIWAPKYGLKGQLDASLLVRLHTADHTRHSSSGRSSSSNQGRSDSSNEGRNSRQVYSGGSTMPAGVLTHRDMNAHAVLQPTVADASAAAASNQGSAVYKGGLQGEKAGSARLRVGMAQDEQLALVPFELKTGKDFFSHRAQVCCRNAMP